MELEKDTFEALVDYLKKHGYPASSIAIEYPVGNKHRLDLAIIDPKSDLPIQIFEVKSKKDKRHIEFGKQQLKTYLSSLKQSDIPAYLVFPKDSHPFFEIQRVKIDTEEEASELDDIHSYGLLNFQMQKQSRLAARIEKTKDKKDTTTTNFNRICWGLSVALFILLIVIKFTSFSLDATELTILAASVLLAIIPFASKLKILGVEFERLQKEKMK